MLEDLLRQLAKRGVLPGADLGHYVPVFNNRANLNLTLFDRKTERRLVFVKLSDLRDFEASFEVLRRIEAVVPGCVPEPLCTLRLGPYQALVTRAYRLELLAGRPRLSAEGQGRVIDRTVDQLLRLHRETRQGTLALDAAFCRGTLAPMAASFLEPWNDAAFSQRLLAYIEALGSEGLQLPRIPQHGDLGAFNVTLVDGKDERVLFIDWDSYGDSELAGLDLTTFVTAFARLYGGGPDAESATNERLRAATVRYCDGIGLDQAVLERIAPVCWLHFAAVKLDIGVREGQQVAYREIERCLRREGGPRPAAARG